MTKEDSFVIDPQCLFYLHPIDGPGAIITAIKFGGMNCELWNCAVTTSLMAKKKMGFIDGSISKPKPTIQ